MKTRIALVAASYALFVAAGNAQTFSNLGFESAIISHLPDDPFMVSFSDAFPYWQSRSGGVEGAATWYDSLALDATAIGIYDTNPNPPPVWSVAPMFGNYSASLQACAMFPPYTDVELAQTGLIPSDTKSLHFATTPLRLSAPGTWELSFRVNGQSIPYSAVSTQTNYTLWAADISAYANTVVEIAFRLQSQALPGHPASEVQPAIGLDEISFSPVAIPEPGSAALLLAGGLLLRGLYQDIRVAVRTLSATPA